MTYWDELVKSADWDKLFAEHAARVLNDAFEEAECRYCAEHRNDPMMPPHTPSPRCESGKRSHCTCDVCF